MKKFIKILIALFFLFPLNLKALTYTDIDYKITDYYIEADISKNGDITINEIISLKGTYNGYIREILYKNANLTDNNYQNNVIYNPTGIEFISAEAKKISNPIDFNTFKNSDFTLLTKGLSANLGYTLTPINNGYEAKMYFANDGQAVFKLSYILKDTIVLHQDVAELYLTFIGDDFDDDIHNLNIKVNLPGIDNSDNFRVWAHGDLAGEIEAYDHSYALATLKKNDANESLDIRLTFDKDLMDQNLVAKKTNDIALQNIIEVETLRADEANQKRTQIKFIYYGLATLTVLWYIALIISAIYVYLKYDKERKSNFTNKYNREFIDDYNVEVIDYLMNKNITSNALTASIMNLVYKKALKLEEIPDTKNKNYKFTLLTTELANETEQDLINFLFNKVGDGTTFTTNDLKKYASSTKTCEKFNSSYFNWKNKVIKDAQKENFFESKSKQIIFGVIFFFTSFLLIGGALIFNVQFPLTYITIIFSIIFLIYTLSFSKRTVKGNDHYVRWKAFKNFLNDFGAFDLKELPEIALWERYLVYATIFGLAQKVSKVMNVKIQEINSDELNSYYGPTFTDYYVYNNLNNAINNIISANTTAITSLRAESISSSGSGFGGGFSSGGGFGGGGGGGHGF